jgi:hypothetical protein
MKFEFCAPCGVLERRLVVEIPSGIPLNDITDTLKKTHGYLSFIIQQPHRPRSTGPHSQNARLNGFIQQLAVATGNSFDDVKAAVKLEAMDAGYPGTVFRGVRVPQSESKASVEECKILIQTVERIAADMGVFLREE